MGRFTDRVHPRILTGAGFAVTAIAIYLLSAADRPGGLPDLGSMALLGSAMAGIWAPLAATATRNLPMQLAGAESGVYNATRQVGAVLGSAAIAVLLDARLAANGLSSGQNAEGGVVHQLPAVVREPFSTAMSQTLCCCRSASCCWGWCR